MEFDSEMQYWFDIQKINTIHHIEGKREKPLDHLSGCRKSFGEKVHMHLWWKLPDNQIKCIHKKPTAGNFPGVAVVQWLRLCAPNAGGPGSIPGQGTRSHIRN